MKHFLFCLLLLSATNIPGQPTSAYPIDTLTPDGAWCWFADPRALYYKGEKEQTYFSWITTQGDIMVAAYNHETGELLQHRIWEKWQSDDHDNPSLLIRDDGRIIIFFAQHFGPPIKRMISTNPEDITSWGTDYELGNNVTYPYPFRIDKTIYVLYRGEDTWHPYLIVSTDNGETFGTPRQFIAGGGQRPYTRYCQGSDGSIHVAVTTGHPRNESANKIYYCRFKDNIFYRANGTQIKNLNTQGAVDVSELEVVYDASAGKGWIWDVALDPQTGNPMLLYAAFPSDTDHRYRYAYWTGSQWYNNEITPAGRWFPQTPAGTTEPEPNYSGGLIFDSGNPSVVYLSKQVNGVFEIFKYTTSDHGASWTPEAITSNTPAGIVNVRPIVPRNHKPGYFDVVWMRGTYTYYADQKYQTALVYKRGVTTENIDSIALSEAAIELLEGTNKPLSVQFFPYLVSDKSLTWDSSDETVATVENGLLSARSPGVTTVRATASNGVSDACEVRVTEPVYLENAFFDFGTTTSPVAAGAIGVSDETLLNESYGWMGSVLTRDRGTSQNDEERDFNMTSGATVFRVYVSNGDYRITIKQGDREYMHDGMTVKVNGETRLEGITAAQGVILTNTFDVATADKKLDFEFSINGSDPNWVVNSIKIEKQAGTETDPGNIRMTRVGESCPNDNVVLLSGQEQLSGQAFQQDALISYNGYQYTVYYNATRNVCIARRKLPLGAWREVVLPHQNTEDDSHNVISMGICANDGTIHLSYDHHNTTLRYCRSVLGLANDVENLKWSASNFGPTVSQLVEGVAVPDVTYPRFIEKPDGNLLFECRYKLSGDGDSYLREYDGNTHRWTSIGRYVQGMDATPDACAYINRMDYDCLGRLHVSWCWRDDFGGGSNHDIFYGYSDDHGRTWKDTRGTQVAVTENIAPTDSRASGACMRQGISSLQIATIAYNRGYINQESQTSDRLGRVHILNSYIPDDAGTDSDWTSSRTKARLHHRFRDTDGTWKVNPVKKNGEEVHSYCRAQILSDAFNNAFVIANGAEIYAATPVDDYSGWELISDSDKDRFCSEPQADHPLLLNDGVLSFVYVGRDKKVVVIDYLTDNPHTPSGTGLKAEQTSTGMKWSGTLETLYGEAYTLYLNTNTPTTIYVDGRKLREKTTQVQEELSVPIPLIASHKHQITVEAQTTNQALPLLSWESAGTPKTPVPAASLYNETIDQDDSDSPWLYAPDLPEKAELPVSLITTAGEIPASLAADYITLPIDPAGDYSIEVNARILSAEGRGMDIDARAGNGNGFRFSIDTGAAYTTAPLTAKELVHTADYTIDRDFRFAVQNGSVYFYQDGQYIAGKKLLPWIGDIDENGNETTAPLQDETNLIADWDGTPDNNAAAPTAYGWGSDVSSSVPWNTANGNSGVRYMDVTSGHTLETGANYSGRLMTIRWDAAALYGSLYYFPLTLEANTTYSFSFLYEWWSNSNGTITAGISTSGSASGIFASQIFSPVLAGTLYEGQFYFRTTTAGVYYSVFTGGNGLMAGIGALSVNKVLDAPRLIVGKNYSGAPAHIQINSITYDDSGAFAPVEKSITKRVETETAKAVVFCRDNTLFIRGIPQNTRLTIYDMQGRTLIHRKEITDAFSTRLFPGMYIVVLHSEYSVYRKKIIAA
jgi:hypothetical protein